MTGRVGAPAPVQIAFLVLLGVAAIYYPLLPLQMEAEADVVPDLLLPLVAAWCIRRPDSAPLLLVALLFLLSDLALQRPVGLWALVCLLITEFLRGQRASLRSRPFPIEWGTFAAALAIGMVVQSLVLFIALVPQPPTGRMVRIFMLTVALYPVIAGMLHWILRIRAPQPAQSSSRLGRVS